MHATDPASIPVPTGGAHRYGGDHAKPLTQVRQAGLVDRRPAYHAMRSARIVDISGKSERAVAP